MCCSGQSIKMFEIRVNCLAGVTTIVVVLELTAAHTPDIDTSLKSPLESPSSSAPKVGIHLDSSPRHHSVVMSKSMAQRTGRTAINAASSSSRVAIGECLGH